MRQAHDRTAEDRPRWPIVGPGPAQLRIAPCSKRSRPSRLTAVAFGQSW